MVLGPYTPAQFPRCLRVGYRESDRRCKDRTSRFFRLFALPQLLEGQFPFTDPHLGLVFSRSDCRWLHISIRRKHFIWPFVGEALEHQPPKDKKRLVLQGRMNNSRARSQLIFEGPCHIRGHPVRVLPRYPSLRYFAVSEPFLPDTRF